MQIKSASVPLAPRRRVHVTPQGQELPRRAVAGGKSHGCQASGLSWRSRHPDVASSSLSPWEILSGGSSVLTQASFAFRDGLRPSALGLSWDLSSSPSSRGTNLFRKPIGSG